MPDKIFIDSNIFIYARVKQPGENKNEKAGRFLESVKGDIIISVQVLNEFYNVLCRYKVDDNTIQENIIEILKDVNLKTNTFKTVQSCWKIRNRYGYSYYDSLIIASALENDCNFLYTEDMHHGQKIDKRLTILNPFKIASPDID